MASRAPKGTADSSALVAAEVLGPDRGAFFAFDLAAAHADPDFAIRAEDVFVVLGRFEPRGEDRAHGRVASRAPGDVLGRPPAPPQVTELLDPELERTTACFVAEFVAADDVGRLLFCR